MIEHFTRYLTVLFAALLFCVHEVPAQEHHPGAHERQLLRHPELPSPPLYKPSSQGNALLTRAVFGYHPYWVSDEALAAYRFDLLSHVAYFSCEVDPSTGRPLTVHDWMSTPLVDSARAHGVKVLLAATCFGAANTRTLLQSPAARDTLIAHLIALLQARGAGGVNIDFEAVPADARDNLTRFMADLRNRLDAAIPGALVSAAVPAVDWTGAWDLPSLADVIDLFFIMGYDYYWSGSATAGPVAPVSTGSLNVTATVDWYLGEGVPPGRIILGVPYYGYDWPVVSDASQASTTGRGTARVYATVQDMLPQAEAQWSTLHRNPWLRYRPSGWRQCWYDDALSLGYKYDLVIERDLAGPGIWALGYDEGHDELWQLIEQRFSVPVAASAVPAAACGLLEAWPRPVPRGAPGLHVRIDAGPGSSVNVRVIDLLGRVRSGRAAQAGDDGRAALFLPYAELPRGAFILDASWGSGRETMLLQRR
jgi:spore germination protein YaaH